MPAKRPLCSSSVPFPPLHEATLHAPLWTCAGAIVGIVGGNGAGKSTLFRLIMGLEKPDNGALSLGDTVAPMYVDQSRDALDDNKTVRCCC